MKREIIFYENYFIDFYISLDSSVQEKIEYVFKVIRTVDRIPLNFLMHIEGTDGFYEMSMIAKSPIAMIISGTRIPSGN
jgi:biotin synthase-like enzyme